MLNLKKITGKEILKNPYFLLLLIVLFGLAFRLAFFSGMGISDSLVYSKTADDLNNGRGINPDSTLTLSTRMGIVYATAFSYRIFGIKDFSSVLFPLLTSLASIILIFYFGKLLFNENVGLISALLISFSPLDVVYSTQLLSDLPSAFFMSLGVYIFLYAELKKPLKYGLSYILSGILIGIGYMIRESALLIALFFIAYIIYKRKIKKEYFLVPLGILLIFTLESLLFLSLTNDALFRFHASQKYLSEASISHNYFGRLDFPMGLFHYPWLFLTNPLLSFFYIPIFIAILYFILKKRKENRKEMLIILLWIIPLLLYLSFGSSSLAQYIPFRAVDRYTSIFTMPAIILLALFISDLSKIKKWILPTFIIILLSASIFHAYISVGQNLLGSLKSSYPFLNTLKKPIYADERSLKALDYISKFTLKENLKPYPANFKSIRDAYVVINPEMIKNLKEANKNKTFPAEIENPPKNWQVVKDNDIIVYYIQK